MRPAMRTSRRAGKSPCARISLSIPWRPSISAISATPMSLAERSPRFSEPSEPECVTGLYLISRDTVTSARLLPPSPDKWDRGIASPRQSGHGAFRCRGRLIVDRSFWHPGRYRNPHRSSSPARRCMSTRNTAITTRPAARADRRPNQSSKTSSDHHRSLSCRDVRLHIG